MIVIDGFDEVDLVFKKVVNVVKWNDVELLLVYVVDMCFF